jgi:transcriptional antiterminator NusG
MKWYVIKVMGGKEKKMKEIIEKELKHNHSENVISQLLIPSQKTLQIRNGKKINVDRNYFPGYILVECESIDEVESNIKHISGVSSVLKQPLSKHEIETILGRESRKDTEEIFGIKQKVKIVDGPFNSFIGTVDEIDNSIQKVKVSVLIFSREVKLDLTFQQIEKVE